MEYDNTRLRLKQKTKNLSAVYGCDPNSVYIPHFLPQQSHYYYSHRINICTPLSVLPKTQTNKTSNVRVVATPEVVCSVTIDTKLYATNHFAPRVPVFYICSTSDNETQPEEEIYTRTNYRSKKRCVPSGLDSATGRDPGGCWFFATPDTVAVGPTLHEPELSFMYRF